MEHPALREDVESSVVGLHDVFQDWLGAGTLGLSFDAVERVLAPAFVLVSPDGREQAREPLLAALRSARGARPGLVIEARETRIVRAEGRLVVARYEEWQRVSTAAAVEPDAEEPWSVRLSLAVLEAALDVPWGFHWHRVQETWSAGRAPGPRA